MHIASSGLKAHIPIVRSLLFFVTSSIEHFKTATLVTSVMFANKGPFHSNTQGTTGQKGQIQGV